MDAAENIAVEETEAPASNAGAATASAQRTPQAVNFRHPAFLSSTEWRKLRMELDELAESTGALLSTHLRMDFSLQVGKLQMLGFTEFTASLASPTHLILF